MNLGEYIRFIVNKLEKEFEKGLEWGFGPDNKIYQYIEDLKIISKKIED